MWSTDLGPLDAGNAMRMAADAKLSNLYALRVNLLFTWGRVPQCQKAHALALALAR